MRCKSCSKQVPSAKQNRAVTLAVASLSRVESLFSREFSANSLLLLELSGTIKDLVEQFIKKFRGGSYKSIMDDSCNGYTWSHLAAMYHTK